MKTEIKVEEEIRGTRNRVFWRLYSLPWAILTLVLIIIASISLWFAIRSNDFSYKQKELPELLELPELRVSMQSQSSSLAKLFDISENIRLKDQIALLEAKVAINFEMGKVEGIEDGKRIIQVEAIEKGFGRWEVDSDVIVKFTWEDTRVGLTNNRVREFPFTYEDFDLANKLGMHLEDDIIFNVHSVIGGIMDMWSKTGQDDQLRKVLLLQVEEVIHKRFDGFETYKKIK